VWTSNSYAMSCAFTRNGENIGAYPVNGSAGVGPVDKTYTHTITCTAIDGTKVSDSVTHELVSNSTGANVIDSITSTSSGATLTLNTGSFKFTKPLQLGAEGEEVIMLQHVLKAKGYNSGIPDGIFGTQLKAAVAKFQAANNLTSDGIVGPEVRALLNK